MLILSILLSSSSSTIFSVMDTDSLISLAMEACITIPSHVYAIF